MAQSCGQVSGITGDLSEDRDVVKAAMGPPAQLLPLPGKGTALYFSRMPEGRHVFEVSEDAQDVIRSIEQTICGLSSRSI